MISLPDSDPTQPYIDMIDDKIRYPCGYTLVSDPTYKDDGTNKDVKIPEDLFGNIMKFQCQLDDMKGTYG